MLLIDTKTPATPVSCMKCHSLWTCWLGQAILASYAHTIPHLVSIPCTQAWQLGMSCLSPCEPTPAVTIKRSEYQMPLFNALGTQTFRDLKEWPECMHGQLCGTVYQDTLNGCPSRSTNLADVNNASAISSSNPRPYRPTAMTPLDAQFSSSQPFNSRFDPWYYYKLAPTYQVRSLLPPFVGWKLVGEQVAGGSGAALGN